jgi:hypothetical protein
MNGINNYKDFLEFISNIDHNKIKEINVKFSQPDVVKAFNIEYFSVKIPKLPGGIICD